MKGYYKIRELAESAPFTTISSEGRLFSQQDMIQFAELIVRECVDECRREWYELNAESIADDNPSADPRATGIRVGQKNGILKCIGRIKKHFGVEE